MVGLFGCVSGTVANLTVTGSINAKVYGGYIAPIAANLAGGKVINCVNRAAITVEGTGTDTLEIMHIGGIAGAVRSGCDTAYIKNSANYGNIAVKAQNVGKGSGDLGDASSVALEGEIGSTIYNAGPGLSSDWLCPFCKSTNFT